jgi:hypothetical protein
MHNDDARTVEWHDSVFCKPESQCQKYDDDDHDHDDDHDDDDDDDDDECVYVYGWVGNEVLYHSLQGSLKNYKCFSHITNNIAALRFITCRLHFILFYFNKYLLSSMFLKSVAWNDIIHFLS